MEKIINEEIKNILNKYRGKANWNSPICLEGKLNIDWDFEVEKIELRHTEGYCNSEAYGKPYIYCESEGKYDSSEDITIFNFIKIFEDEIIEDDFFKEGWH